MQQCLALLAAAGYVAGFAMFAKLRDVSANGAPACDLAFIIFASSSHVISAIPLEPAARVFAIDPTFLLPIGKRLGCIHAKVIQFRIVKLMTELCVGEPACRKFFLAVGHVLAAEYAKLEHFARRQLRPKAGVEVAADWLREFIDITSLHKIVDDDALGFHRLEFMKASFKFKLPQRRRERRDIYNRMSEISFSSATSASLR